MRVLLFFVMAYTWVNAIVDDEVWWMSFYRYKSNRAWAAVMIETDIVYCLMTFRHDASLFKLDKQRQSVKNRWTLYWMSNIKSENSLLVPYLGSHIFLCRFVVVDRDVVAIMIIAPVMLKQEINRQTDGSLLGFYRFFSYRLFNHTDYV